MLTFSRDSQKLMVSAPTYKSANPSLWCQNCRVPNEELLLTLPQPTWKVLKVFTIGVAEKMENLTIRWSARLHDAAKTGSHDNNSASSMSHKWQHCCCDSCYPPYIHIHQLENRRWLKCSNALIYVYLLFCKYSQKSIRHHQKHLFLHY